MESFKKISIHGLICTLRRDLEVNKGNTKGKFLVICYRIANYFCLIREQHPILGLIGFPVILSYKFLVTWLLGVEIQVKAKIGKGLTIYHGQGLIIHEGTRIGESVILRHNTTIGSLENLNGKTVSPHIKDGVDIGCHSVLLGEITIGENTAIGAGSVVTSDLPPNCVAVGNPAKIIKLRNQEDKGVKQA